MGSNTICKRAKHHTIHSHLKMNWTSSLGVLTSKTSLHLPFVTKTLVIKVKFAP